MTIRFERSRIADDQPFLVHAAGYFASKNSVSPSEGDSFQRPALSYIAQGKVSLPFTKLTIDGLHIGTLVKSVIQVWVSTSPRVSAAPVAVLP